MNNHEKNVQLVKTLIVDDHFLIRLGLKTMLHIFKKEMEFEIHEMESGEKALQYLNRSAADLAIIDYKMDGMSGPETIERMLRFRPEIKILALSYYNEQAAISSMMDAGALGYVLKNISPQEFFTAVKTVLAGKKYFCSDAALIMIAATEKKDLSTKTAHYKISGREQEVLALIVQGLSNGQIAEQLFLNRRTIDTHRQNLLKKMKVNNTAGLVRIALEQRLLE